MAGRARRRRGRVLVPVALLAVLLGGGYVAADVADVVPGVLTTRPERRPDPPFPQAEVPAAEAPDAVTGPDETAAQPAADDLDAITAHLLGHAAVGSAGVLVTDVLTGEDLHAVAADETHVPASTTKLLTAVAAVAAAGADHRFETRVVDDGDRVVLVGGGDLALAEGVGDPDAVVGHAGLADLAAATAASLTERGVTSVTVGLDVGYYVGPDMPPRWDDEDLAIGDAMHMAPLAIDIGRQEGRRERVADPAGEAAAAFVDALVAEGVTVEGEVADVTVSPDAVEIASVASAPLGDLAAYMLRHSENILAEGIGRLVAHATEQEPSFTGAGLAIAEVLDGLGVDVAGLELHDTSGLSSTNRISPRTLVASLLAVAERPELGAVARGLPVAGLEGTLSDRLREPPAAGLVAAKTGTLRATATLAGYATTDDGRLVAFAVMVGDVPTGAIAGARGAIDTWTAALAACGC